MQKKLAFAGACLISLVIIVVIVLNMDWGLFLAEIKRVNIPILLTYLILFYFCFIVRALRWKYLLPLNSRAELKDLQDATILGFFATNILPLRAGEFIRPLILSKWTGAKFASCFASIVSERVFDVLALLLLLGISLQYIEARHELIYLGAQALAAIALIILFVMVLSYFQSKRMLSILDACLGLCFSKESKLRQKILALAEDFIAGFKSIQNFRELLIVLGYSVLQWLIVSFVYQVFLWSFAVYPSFNVGVIIMLMVAFAVAVPSAPGFLGTFQFGCIIALSVLYPYSKEFAVAYSVVSLGVQYVVLNLAGLYVLKKRGLNFSELRKTSQATI